VLKPLNDWGAFRVGSRPAAVAALLYERAGELCLPFVRLGGRLLAMRSGAEAAWAGAPLLGGGEPEVVAAPSPLRDRGVVVVIPKETPTPDLYPRRPGVPGKRPLGKL